MKYLLFLLVITVLGCSNTTSSNRKVESHEYLITKRRIGIVSIGSNIDSTLRRLKEDYQIKIDSLSACEGCDEYTRVYLVIEKKTKKTLFSIEPGWEKSDKDKVFRLSTKCTEFKTELGIRVGMKVRDLKQNYKIEDVDINGDTGIHILVNDINGSFGIEIPQTESWWNFNKTTLPDSLKIEEIIII